MLVVLFLAFTLLVNVQASTPYICTELKEDEKLYDFSKKEEVDLETICKYKYSGGQYRNNNKRCCVPKKCLTEDDDKLMHDEVWPCKKNTFPYNNKISNKKIKKKSTMCVNVRPFEKMICTKHHKCEVSKPVICTKEYMPHTCTYKKQTVTAGNKCEARASLYRLLCSNEKEIYLDIGKIRCLRKKDLQKSTHNHDRKGRIFGTPHCYICGQHGHLARDCPNAKRTISE